LNRTRKTSPREEAELVAWHLSRMTVKTKADQYGISVTTLRNILARNGLGVRGEPSFKDRLIRKVERERRAYT
jgi:hypothetical protein